MVSDTLMGKNNNKTNKRGKTHLRGLKKKTDDDIQVESNKVQRLSYCGPLEVVSPLFISVPHFTWVFVFPTTFYVYSLHLNTKICTFYSLRDQNRLDIFQHPFTSPKTSAEELNFWKAQFKFVVISIYSVVFLIKMEYAYSLTFPKLAIKAINQANLTVILLNKTHYVTKEG